MYYQSKKNGKFYWFPVKPIPHIEHFISVDSLEIGENSSDPDDMIEHRDCWGWFDQITPEYLTANFRYNLLDIGFIMHIEQFLDRQLERYIRNNGNKAEFLKWMERSVINSIPDHADARVYVVQWTEKQKTDDDQTDTFNWWDDKRAMENINLGIYALSNMLSGSKNHDSKLMWQQIIERDGHVIGFPEVEQNYFMEEEINPHSHGLTQKQLALHYVLRQEVGEYPKFNLGQEQGYKEIANRHDVSWKAFQTAYNKLRYKSERVQLGAKNLQLVVDSLDKYPKAKLSAQSLLERAQLKP